MLKLKVSSCLKNEKQTLYLIEYLYTVELEWLKHLWNHENTFETGIVRTNEC